MLILLFIQIITVLGQEAVQKGTIKVGPLLNELAPYEIDHHLPTFPIPFTLPLQDPNDEQADEKQKNAKEYLYFPGEDSGADRDSSILRCRAMGGELYGAGKNLIQELLACAVGEPVHIIRSEEKKHSGGDGCWIMLPGGAMASAPEFCKRTFGSVCAVTSK